MPATDSRHATPAGSSPPNPGEESTTRRRPIGSRARTTASACSQWASPPPAAAVCSTDTPSALSVTDSTDRPVCTATPSECRWAPSGPHSVLS